MKRRYVLLAPLALLGCGSRPPSPRRRFGSARVRIVVENRLGGSFRLVGAKLALGERPIYEQTAERLGEQREFVVYDAVLDAGEHDLDVVLSLRGEGHGVFSYLKGYRFTAKTRERFEVEGDQRVTVRVVAHERGGPTTPLEERPGISVSVEPD